MQSGAQAPSLVQRAGVTAEEREMSIGRGNAVDAEGESGNVFGVEGKEEGVASVRE